MVSQRSLINANAIQCHLEGGGPNILIGLGSIHAMRRRLAEHPDSSCFGEIGCPNRQAPLKETMACAVAGIFRLLLIPIARLTGPLGFGPVTGSASQDEATRHFFHRG